MVLAGDIGGTKTDLAIFSVEGGPHEPLIQTEVHSADYPSLQALVSEFLKKVKTPVERASFDVAEPVINGRVQITNLPWVMDEVVMKFEVFPDADSVAREAGESKQVLDPSEASDRTVRCPSAGEPICNQASASWRRCGPGSRSKWEKAGLFPR